MVLHTITALAVLIIRKDGLADSDNTMTNVIQSFQRVNVSYTPLVGPALYQDTLRPPGAVTVTVAESGFWGERSVTGCQV